MLTRVDTNTSLGKKSKILNYFYLGEKSYLHQFEIKETGSVDEKASNLNNEVQKLSDLRRENDGNLNFEMFLKDASPFVVCLDKM